MRGIKGYALYAAGFFVVLEIMLAAAIYWWPTFAENIPSLKKFAAPIAALGQLVDQVDQFGVDGYVVGQHYFKGCGALGTAAAVLFAAPAIAGEAHRGTMEMWLARPVSRARLLTERWIGGALAVAVPVFATSLTVPLLLSLTGDKSMDWSDLLRCSLHMSLFLIAIYAVTFLWSSFGSEPMRISFTMLFITVLLFALYLVEGVTNYSLFRLVDIEVFMELVTSDALNWRIVGPLLAVTIVAYALSLRAFRVRVP
ncbi:MAG: ABC transporter permease subunit [Planctomycetota bacterium]